MVRNPSFEHKGFRTIRLAFGRFFDNFTFQNIVYQGDIVCIDDGIFLWEVPSGQQLVLNNNDENSSKQPKITDIINKKLSYRHNIHKASSELVTDKVDFLL